MTEQGLASAMGSQAFPLGLTAGLWFLLCCIGVRSLNGIWPTLVFSCRLILSQFAASTLIGEYALPKTARGPSHADVIFLSLGILLLFVLGDSVSMRAKPLNLFIHNMSVVICYTALMLCGCLFWAVPFQIIDSMDHRHPFPAGALLLFAGAVIALLAIKELHARFNGTSRTSVWEPLQHPSWAPADVPPIRPNTPAA